MSPDIHSVLVLQSSQPTHELCGRMATLMIRSDGDMSGGSLAAVDAGSAVTTRGRDHFPGRPGVRPHHDLQKIIENWRANFSDDSDEEGARADSQSPDAPSLVVRSAPLRKAQSLRAAPAHTRQRSNSKLKAVRFADWLGLDLAHVRPLYNADLPPVVPPSAFRHLQIRDDERKPKADVALWRTNRQQWKPNFQAPVERPDFFVRLQSARVLLETARIDAESRRLVGTVRVVNVAYEKSVAVRATFDQWRRHVDVAATFIDSFDGGQSDRFRFALFVPADAVSVELALVFRAQHQQCWDNNEGANYRFDAIKVN